MYDKKTVSECIARAMDLAIETHAEQYDKLGRNCLFHLTQVAGMTRNDEELIVAWLHDYVDDSSYSREECIKTLKNDFPEGIVAAVLALSHEEDESREDYINRVVKNPLAAKVKYYDLRSNCDIIRLKKLSGEEAKKIVNRCRRDVEQLKEFGVLTDKQLDFIYNKAMKIIP